MSNIDIQMNENDILLEDVSPSRDSAHLTIHLKSKMNSLLSKNLNDCSPGISKIPVHKVIQKMSANFEAPDFDFSSSNQLKKLRSIINKKILLPIRLRRNNHPRNHKIQLAYYDLFRDYSDLNPVENSKTTKFHLYMKKLNYLSNKVAQPFHRLSNFLTSDKKKSSVNRERFTKKEKKNKELLRLFRPDSLPHIIWNSFFVLAMILFIILMPLKIAFAVEFSQSYKNFELALNIFLSLDTFVVFNTGLYQKGFLVMNRKEVTMHLLRHRLIIEVIAQIGLIYAIILYFNENKPYQFIILFNFIKIIVLPGIYNQINDLLQLSDTLTQVARIIQLGSLVAVISHIFACIFYASGTYSLKWYPSNWIIENGMDNAFLWEKYITSMYWTVATMATVGYGDVSATNVTEQLFSIVMVLISSAVFAYSINTVGAILNHFEEMDIENRQKLALVTYHMKQTGMDPELRLRIRRYLQFVFWQLRTKKKEVDEIFKLLNEELRNEALYDVNIKILNSFEIFSTNFNEDAMYEISLKMKVFSPLPGEIIIEEDDNSAKSYSTYFVAEGTVEIYKKNSNTILANIQKGKMFGEISFFSGLPRSASARSSDFATLYSLDRKDILDIVKTYNVEFFFQEQDKIIYYKDYSSFRILCYGCQKYGHLANDCRDTHLLPNIKAVHLKRSVNNRRLAIRFNRRKFHPLFHMAEINSIGFQFKNESESKNEYDVTGTSPSSTIVERHNRKKQRLESKVHQTFFLNQKTETAMQDDELINSEVSEKKSQKSKGRKDQKKICLDVLKVTSHYFNDRNVEKLIELVNQKVSVEANQNNEKEQSDDGEEQINKSDSSSSSSEKIEEVVQDSNQPSDLPAKSARAKFSLIANSLSPLRRKTQRDSEISLQLMKRPSKNDLN